MHSIYIQYTSINKLSKGWAALVNTISSYFDISNEIYSSYKIKPINHKYLITGKIFYMIQMLFAEDQWQDW